MKSFLQKIMFSIVVVLITAISVYAQVPQGFNFQAVARGANGEILANQALGVQVSIIKGTEEGNPIYKESHSVTTNPLGLMQLVIGEGTPAEGQIFSEVDFSNDNYYVKLAIDPAGGTEYEDLGTTRLLSVPYALVAQKAIEGGTGSGGDVLEYNLNTGNADSSFVINLEGDKQAKPFQVFSKSTSDNRAVWGEAFSEASNTGSQRGVLGFSNGEGTGSHIGVFGSAVNFDATGSARQGLYGQAASKAKFNYGTRALAQGDGSGEIVPLGEEVDGNFGSYNIAGGFYSSGNLNGNVGVEAQASGSNGSRIDFGLIARAIGTGNSQNVGVRGEAFNSPMQNVSFDGEANGQSQNIGLRLNVHSGNSNLGMVVNADTAAILNGHSVINGDLTVNGTINGSIGEGGSANGQTLDSLFLSTPPEAEFQRNTSFYPGFIRNSDQNGNFVNFSSSRLQYGNTDSEGTGFVYNWYDKGGMQVAADDYLNGERASGMNGGYFYMDIAKDDNFYLPLEFGIQNAAEGGRSWFRMSSLAMKEAGKGDLFTANVVNDPNGGDPNGETAELFIFGDESPNLQMGGQQWNNANLGFLSMYGSTSNGDGWYHSNANLAVISDGTDEWGSFSITKTNITGQTSQETILLDGGSGNINISGTLTQSSDERLKKSIKTLDNALENTLKMRGVSYTWKTDVTNDNPQIGVVAQEVEKIYPEFVHTDEDGMKSVNYAQLTAVLIEAVKELNHKLKDLKNDNATLQAKLDKQQELENRLLRIEELISSRSVKQSGSLTNENK
ncbi:MAG: tail fiber domain-containing protein [Balneola sp.]